MHFIGKKTTRLWLPWQICVDPFKAAEIRDRAVRSSRKLEDQLRYLIVLGLEREDELQRNAQKLTLHHGGSHDHGAALHPLHRD